MVISRGHPDSVAIVERIILFFIRGDHAHHEINRNIPIEAAYQRYFGDINDNLYVPGESSMIPSLFFARLT